MENVLIISDDQELLEDLKGRLSSNDIMLYTLPGREDVLKDVAQINPSLLLIDFLLRRANGGTLCHQIRGHQELQHIPVILLTDYPNVERFTAKFGCNAIIRKPISAHELIKTLSIMLENRELSVAAH